MAHEVKAKFTADTTSFSKGLATVKSGLGSVMSKVAMVAAPIAGLVAGIGGIGIAVQSVNKAADFEALTSQFETLLGSAGLAQERMAELARFAASTPFGVEDLAQTSAILQEMSKGALSSGEGLKMVGDVAAASGKPITEIAQILGKLHLQIREEKKLTEVFQQLQERGVKLGNAIQEVNKAQDEGKSSADVWKIMARGLRESEGGMIRASKTFHGLISTLKDNWVALQIEFGKPIMNALKPIILDATDKLQSLQQAAREAGQAVGAGLEVIYNAFKAGELWSLAKVGIAAAFTFGVNVLLKGVVVAAKAFGELLRADLSGMGEGLRKVFANRGLITALSALFTGLGLIMVDTINKFMKSTPMLSGGANHKTNYQNSIETHMSIARNSLGAAGTELADGLADITENLGKGAVAVGDLYKNQADVLNVAGAMKDLKDASRKYRNPLLGEDTGLSHDVPNDPKLIKAVTSAAITAAAKTKTNPLQTLSVSSLSKVGGDRSEFGTTLNNLQQKANHYLQQIAKNTSSTQAPRLA